jgi:membrane protease subunit HflK
MYLETMESVLGKVDTTVIESPGVQAYLPLPEVQRRNRQAQEAQQ